MAITIAKLNNLCGYLARYAPVTAISSTSGNSSQTRIECRSPSVKDVNKHFFHYVDNAITNFTLRTGYKVVDATDIVVTPTDETTKRRSGINVDHSSLPNDNQLGTLEGPFFQTYSFRRWIIPSKWDTTEFQNFISGFSSNDGAIPSRQRFASRTPDVLPIYLNDFSQNKTPVYYPKRRR